MKFFDRLSKFFGIGRHKPPMPVEQLTLPPSPAMLRRHTNGAFGGPQPAGSKLAKRFQNGSIKGPRGY